MESKTSPFLVSPFHDSPRELGETKHSLFVNQSRNSSVRYWKKEWV